MPSLFYAINQLSVTVPIPGTFFLSISYKNPVYINEIILYLLEKSLGL